jgi:hypothetical protein
MSTRSGSVGVDQAVKLSTRAYIRKVRGSNLGQDTTCHNLASLCLSMFCSSLTAAAVAAAFLVTRKGVL